MKIQVAGNAKIDNRIIPIHGNIEVLNKTDKVAYASWCLFDSSNNLLASVSRSYFIGGKTDSNKELLDMIISNILNYRMGRQRVFSEIEVA